MKNQKLIFEIFLYLTLTLFLLIFVGPFIWMALSSFKNQAEIIGHPPTFFPKVFTMHNYEKVFTKIPIIRFYLNSIFLSVTRTALVVFTSAALGYIFAKFEFKGKNLFFAIVLSTMMMPFPLLMTPLYLEISYFNWIDSYTGIIVPSAFSAFGIFLMRQSMFAFPGDLREAARIDGCNEFRIFFTIVLPLSKASLSSLAILNFMENWDDFFWPLIVLQTKIKYNIPLGLNLLSLDYSTDYGAVMAGATFSVVPIMIVFFIMQKNFIESLSMTGIKG